MGLDLKSVKPREKISTQNVRRWTGRIILGRHGCDPVTSISLPDDPEALKSMIVALGVYATLRLSSNYMHGIVMRSRRSRYLADRLLRAETELLRLKKWYC